MFEKYVGIPFKDKGRDQSGTDCWGLIRLVFKTEKSVDLPDLSGDYEDTHDCAGINATYIKEAQSRWKPVEAGKEKPMDVAVFKIKGMPMHVGIVLSRKRFLHVSRGMDSVIDRYDSLRWRNRIEGFYRYG